MISILNHKRKTGLLLFVILTAMALTACGDDKESNDNVTDSESSNEIEEEENSNEETQGDQKSDEFYQVGETATIISEMYGFEYEATVNEYEITDSSDKYDMNDFFLNYDENVDGFDNAYIIITDITIHNTSDENFTPSKHIPMHVSEKGYESGEDVMFDYSPDFDENLEPGDSVTGELVIPIDIGENDNIEEYWFKFETISENETIWILPNTVK